MMQTILALGLSDVCHGWPGFASYAATQSAHVLIGAALGVLTFTGRAGRVAAFLALASLMGKELVADMPSCAFAWPVILDSGADVGAYTFGLMLARYGIAAARERLYRAQSTWGRGDTAGSAGPAPSGPLSVFQGH